MESLALKSRYVLRGVMFWGYTSGRSGKLLETMASGLGVKLAPKPRGPRRPNRAEPRAG